MERGFFKWLWRFNGLAIAAGVTLILALLADEVLRDLRRAFFPRNVTNTLAVDPALPAGETVAETPPETRRIGAPFGPTGQRHIAVPIIVSQTLAHRGISKGSSGNTVDYRILDTQTGQSRALFGAGARLILDTRQIYAPDSRNRPLGIVLSVVETDSSGDGRLSASDTQALYITTRDWTAPVRVRGGLSAITALDATPTEMRAIVKERGSYTALIIAPDTGEILSEIPIPLD
ncbi:hypothetical protein KDD17_11870 [Sulfitobacter albidus]|uniref:Uncharacterized protein n=1 Tax=Sulfitobacter albidus TaxID=2829501 RepID=A0A975PLG4_9RHOB|nr:hypothetical protein [Sulfitobacter albidus]QUJ75649.1 hypothetical protein KDD17_11870 [Sulfitobacter albidus]